MVGFTEIEGAVVEGVFRAYSNSPVWKKNFMATTGPAFTSHSSKRTEEWSSKCTSSIKSKSSFSTTLYVFGYSARYSMY